MLLCFQFAIAETALRRAARFVGSGPLVAASRESAGAAALSRPGDRSEVRLAALDADPVGSFAADLEGVAAGGGVGAVRPLSCRVAGSLRWMRTRLLPHFG